MSSRRKPRLPARVVAAALLDLELPAEHPVRLALEEARRDVAREARRQVFRRFCRRHEATYEGATTDLVRAAARLLGVSDATAWRWWAKTRTSAETRE